MTLVPHLMRDSACVSFFKIRTWMCKCFQLLWGIFIYLQNSVTIMELKYSGKFHLKIFLLILSQTFSIQQQKVPFSRKLWYTESILTSLLQGQNPLYILCPWTYMNGKERMKKICSLFSERNTASNKYLLKMFSSLYFLP